MATKTFTWANWTTGWENLADAGNSANIAYTSGSTSAKFTQTAKNVTSTEYARKSGAGDDWADIFGIDPTNTVSQIRITGWTKRVVTNTKLTSHTITMKFIDDSAGTVGTLISASAMATTTDVGFISMGATSASPIGAAYTSGSTNVRLSLEYTTVVANSSGNSAIDTRFDDITIEITYALTFKGTVSNSAHVNTSGNVDLKQKYNLSIDNAAHAQTVDSVSIAYTPPHFEITTANDEHHAVTSTLIDLIENYDVPPDSTVHNVASPEVLLTSHEPVQNYTLSVNGTVHVVSTPSAVSVSNPQITPQNTTWTNNLPADGINFAYGESLVIDKYNKLIALEQNYDTDPRLKFVYSNDNGATWTDGLQQNFLIRGSMAYDNVNDIIHILWLAEYDTDGILYRRYTISRDGSNNITGIVWDTNGNLSIDYKTSGAVQYDHPNTFWLNDPAYGTYGAILGIWGAKQSGAASNGAEVRSSMRILSNTADDNVAANWTYPVTDSTSTLTTDAQVPYTCIFNTAAEARQYPTANRKLNGTNAKDVYITFNPPGTEIHFRRMRWNSSNNNWSTGITDDAVLVDTVRSGTNSGYGAKFEITAQPREDAQNDTMVVGYGNWKDNTVGDTWSYVAIKNDDTISSIVDAYSGGAANCGTTIFVVGDIATQSGYTFVSYTDLPDKAFYIRGFDKNGSEIQASTLFFSGCPVDIPNLYQHGTNSIYNNGSGNKLVSLFRNFNVESRQNPPTYTPPYNGYLGTMDWSLGLVLTAHNPQANQLTVQNSINKVTSDAVSLVQHYSIAIQSTVHSHTSANAVLTQHQVLVVSSTAHLQTSSNTVLTQHQLLSVESPVVHAHTSANTVLTQHQILVAGNSAHAQASDNVVLTQHQILSINGTQHAQTAANVTLTAYIPSWTLTVQSTQHLQISSSVSLTQHQILSVNGAVHSHTSDNAVLTQHQILTVNNAIHNQTSDNVVLTQHQILVIQSSAHAQTSANVIIIPSGALAVQNSAHAQISDNVALTQHYILVVGNAVHAQTANDTILAQHYGALAVGNVSHLHTSGNVILTQHQILAVENDVHSQTSGNVALTQHQILIVDNSANLQTSANAVLTQHQILSVSNAINLQTTSVINLIPSGAIGAQSSVHVQTTSSVGLTQHQVLSVGNIIHAQISDNVILNQHQVLSTNGAIQLQTSSAVTLSQGTALALVNNCIQLQISQNVDLTQHQVLVVLIAIQLLASNNISLGAGGNIIPKVMHYIRLRSK